MKRHAHIAFKHKKDKNTQKYRHKNKITQKWKKNPQKYKITKTQKYKNTNFAPAQVYDLDQIA